MYLKPSHLPLVIPLVIMIIHTNHFKLSCISVPLIFHWSSHFINQSQRQVLMGQLVGTVTTDEVRWSNQAIWVWTPKTGDMSWGMVQEKLWVLWDVTIKNGGIHGI
jgi:hypothetical protein